MMMPSGLDQAEVSTFLFAEGFTASHADVINDNESFALCLSVHH